MFWKIALLNLQKHGRRTALIVFAVLLSVVIVLLIDGVLSGMRESFFRTTLQDSGHVQLHDEGYAERLNEMSLDYQVGEPEKLLETLREDPRVAYAEKVLPFGALLVKEGKNIPIAGYGISPESNYFARAREGIARGHMPREAGDIAISRSVAELLNVEYQDPLVVLVQDSSGSPYYVEYTINGVFDSGSRQFDDTHFFITHGAAQELVYLGNNTVELRVNLKDPGKAAAFAKDVSQQAAFEKLEVRTWKEIHGSIVIFLEFFDVILIATNLLMILVVASVITNAVLMNVFERTQEFGTLRAIGMKKRQQLAMVLAEGGFQGFFGGAAGLLLGLPLVLYFQQHGIQFGDYMNSFGFGSVIHVHVTAASVLRSFLTGFVMAVAAALYAGAVSARMRIVDMFEEV